MTVRSILSSTTSSTWQNFNPKTKIGRGWRKIKRILDHHTDAISSLGILTVTTGVLAAKIFPRMPAIIGSSGRLFLEFCGIIWLNVQVKEFFKSKQDCLQAMRSLECEPIIKTMIKVIIKGINILLTCAYFGASIATFIRFSQISLRTYMALRPLSLVILSAEIINDIWDYTTNKKLLRKFDFIEGQENGSQQLARVMRSYLRIHLENQNHNVQIDKKETKTAENKLASSIVRQLDLFTLEQLQENSSSKTGDSRTKALQLYYNVKDGLGNIQARVKSNLTLTVLSYVSRGICKMYPDSLIEMLARWGMSVLFTDELVFKYKLRQMDLHRDNDFPELLI